MAQIPPIDDAYIDSIIKSAEAYTPGLNKTQGVKLRELIKLMRDRAEQQSAGISVTGAVLTGLSTATNSPVNDTDTILSAAGKLQAQITTRLTGTIATDAETQIVATVTEDNKFVSRLKLFNWWTWVKGQVHTFAAKITFTTAPRFSSATANQYLKVDANKDLTGVASIPAADVTQSATLRFLTDTERTAWNAKQAALSIPTDAEMQSGTDNVKYITPLRNATWWTWAKTVSQSVTGLWTFSGIRLFAGTAPVAPAAGHIWYESLNNALKFRKGLQTVDVITTLDNATYAGTGNRVMQFSSVGNLEVPNEVLDGFISDTDVISAITAATYNSANFFTAYITPANSKNMYLNQEYHDPVSVHSYKAIGQNIVRRYSAG